MTFTEQIITIAMCILGTMATRFLPFIVFRGPHAPIYIQYLGQALPAAIFGMLIVYCLKEVSWLTGTHGLTELVSIAVTALLHIWKRQMLVSIAGGTIFYMALIRLIA